MKRVLIVVLILMAMSGLWAMGTPELEGEIPAELEGKLVHQEGHVSYYFPASEEMGQLADGEYIGSIDGNMLDKGQVKITVENHQVVAVEIVDIVMSGYAGKDGNEEEVYRELPLQVIERQSPRVDSVTGATGTTHVFQICVTRALWQASEGEDPMEPYVSY